MQPLVVPALFAGLVAACMHLSNDDGECCMCSFVRHVLRQLVHREVQGMGIRDASAHGAPHLENHPLVLALDYI